MSAMSATEDKLTLSDLRRRWEQALSASGRAVARNPGAYRELKSLAAAIVANPLDINDYLPTAKRLAALVEALDPGGSGSIFAQFGNRFVPASIWQVNLLRSECRDLLAYLESFDRWRQEKQHLKIVR